MAAKTKSKGFSRFLDFIGLVDSDEDDVFDDEEEQPKPRSSGRTSSRSSGRTAESDHGAAPSRSSGRSSARSSSRTVDDSLYSSTRTGRSSVRSAAPARDEEDEYWRNSWSTRETREERSSARDERGSRDYQRDRDADVSSRHQTVIFHLRRFEDCRDVILALLDRKSVLLNLDPLDEGTAQRVIDAMGGAAFALGALISKASDKNYLITPNNVTVANGNVEPRRKSERYL